MVYTVTFNPALDYVVRMEDLQPGETNRTVSDEIQFGCKGINVSTVLRNLGVDNVVLGFLAGFTGKGLEQGLREIGLNTDFIWLEKGLTRINVKIKAGQETEINGQGPDIPAAALEKLFGKLDRLQERDVLVLAGSIPAFLDSGAVKDGIIYECVKKGVPFVLAGSIRDDGPLPEVYADVYAAQDAMRAEVRKATTVICMASALHTIATGNMTPSYRVVDGTVRPLYFYSVDVSEFAVNKLRDRGSLAVRTLVTNAQDFIVHVSRGVAQ